MPKSTDGDIRLSVGVDTAGVNRGTSSIKQSFSKLGKVIATALSVKAIVNFSKQAIALASDVQEVQNVVDVSFGDMAYKIEEFASVSIKQFGISRLAAKQTAGTYMSMATSMGINSEAASNMAVSLTGLTGDVASFYNISQELAATKLKGVFTGETEALKDLGVVMTEANLEQFALSKGITKNTQDMSQAEKVALRYAYVTETLSNASGDFARTQDSWANQTRIFSENWKELMSNIGTVLIAGLTPALNVLNTLLSYLIELSQRLASLFGLTAEAASETTSAVTNTVNEEENLADAVEATAEANKKSLFGFDEINKLTESSTEKKTSSSSGTSALDLLPTTTGLGDSINKELKKIDFSVLKNGFGNFFDKIASINTELGKIDFSALKVAFNSFLQGLISIASSTVGLLATVFNGIITTFSNIFSIVTAGFQLWLDGNSEKLLLWVMEIPLNISQAIDNISEIFGKIFEIFNETIEENKKPSKKAISSFINGISSLFGNIGLIMSDAWKSATSVISNWVADNSNLIKKFFDSIITLSNEAMSFFGTVFSSIGDTLLEWWETSFKPVWEGLVELLMDVAGVVLDIWNEWIYPVILSLIDWATKLYEEHIEPMIENLLELISAVGEFIVMLWENILSPIVDWIIDYLAPIIVNAFNIIWSVCETVIGWICDVISGLAKTLTGLIRFITGIFTGNWEKAWEGIKGFISGIWDMMWDSIKASINLIIDGINWLWSGIYNAVCGIINTIGDIAGVVGDLLGQDWYFGIPSEPPLIPKLAQGAVIPPNREFLAILGDQKHGTNIEAPLDTIKQAVAEVIGQGTGGGDWTIQIVDNRGNVTGEAIITAAQRYNKRAGTTIIPIGG